MRQEREERRVVRAALWVLAVLLAAGQGAPVWAVNKCVGADGKVTYTDSPCMANSRVTRIDTPPPPTADEQAEARVRGEQMIREARALEARQATEAAERRRQQASAQAAELAAQQAAQLRQAREDAAREEAARMVVVRPYIPRYWPPAVPAPSRPKPVEREKPAPMGAFPFR